MGEAGLVRWQRGATQVDLLQEAPRREAAAVADPSVAVAQMAASLEAALREGTLEDMPAFALPELFLPLEAPQEGGRREGSGGPAGGNVPVNTPVGGQVGERDGSEGGSQEESSGKVMKDAIGDEEGGVERAVRGAERRMVGRDGHGLDRGFWEGEGGGGGVTWGERGSDTARETSCGDDGRVEGGEEGCAEESAEFAASRGQQTKHGARPIGKPARVLTSVRTGLGLRTLRLELDRLIQEQGLVRPPDSL